MNTLMASAPRQTTDAFNLRVQRTQAIEAFQRGDVRRAFRLGSDVLRKTPRDHGVAEMVGLAAVQLGLGEPAEKLLRKVVKAEPARATARLGLADASALLGKLDAALEGYERVLRDDPGSRPAAVGKAMVLDRRGEHDDARRILRPFVESGAEDATMAAIWATIEQSAGRYDGTVDLLLKHLRSPRTPLTPRRTLCQLAAKAFAKSGEHDRAFAAFEASNRVIERPFDPDEYVAHIDDLMSTFSAANLAQLPRAQTRSDRPVFVACMPRSGSTLCEQIVHAHPAAFGAGEITEIEELVLGLPNRLESLNAYPACLGDWTQEQADACGGWYLRELDRYDRRAKRVVNKHLDNDLHLGMIALTCPGARIIHCHRHPMDNGLSIFMAAMNPEKYPWAGNLEHIGLAYRQHQRLMDHWRDVLDLPILDVPYEEVVADPETWIRRIIDFCGLPWDDRCLRSHEASRDVATLSYDQVRRPIYKTAVQRWKKYESHLAPLAAALAANA
ncbi:MAG: tetratricopeptide repeat protein [Planctomycetes bacterium]|nr:tetratricopeptide repeat protein [Planctomycetota bacterium]